jgi:hypothetical protein
VGGQGTIRATVGGLPLANATLEITEPDGTSFQATTDANGGYVLPFRFEGNYTVRLVSAGVSVRTHLIAVALPPSSRPVERPTVAEEQTKYGWLLPIILVMVLAFLVYWKLRPAGKSRKK